MIIATRTLTVQTRSGGERPVTVSLHAPGEEGGIWRCAYEINWPEDGWPAETTTGHARGADAMHALQMGLQKVGMELHASRYHSEGTMYWASGRVGYGFIVPKDARDLLRGDDATFYG